MSGRHVKLRLVGDDPDDWLNDSACRGTPIEWWFFNQRDGNEPDREALARAQWICHRCPVLTECRQWGDRIETNVAQLYGFHGGEMPKQRRARRLKERRANAQG